MDSWQSVRIHENLVDHAASVATSNTMTPLNKTSDAHDVRLAIEGDREAFGRLYDRYATAVRAVVVAVSSDFSAVEDMTQETFLRGYKRLTTLRDVDGFRRWILGIARMVARERRREISRNRHRLEADGNGYVPTVEVHDMMELDEELRRVVSAVEELPERERLAVHAYFFHEASGDRAATRMGLSRSGFYAALERGMDRLRNRLAITSKNVRTEQ